MGPLTISYIATIAALILVTAIWLWTVVRKTRFKPFSTLELVTLSMMVCLLYVAVIPWQIGLSRIPGLDAFVFSIPYSVVLLLALRLIPKPGAALLLVVGQGLLGQLLGRGLNPVWWPYYLWCGMAVELAASAVGNWGKRPGSAIGIAVSRGGVSYAYNYLILAPLIWHHYYAAWYVAMKITMGILGCAVGGWIAWRIAPSVEKWNRFVG